MAITFTDVVTSRSGQRPVTFPPESLHQIRRVWNSRRELRGIEELAHQIAASPVGQIEPGIVRKGEGGKPELIAGNRRLAAIEFINANLDLFSGLYPDTISGPLGFKSIAVDCSEEEAIEINLSENLDKLALSPIDKAHALRSLENRGWAPSRIAHALRVTTTYLPTLRSYLTLPEAAQKELHDGVLTGDLAKSLVGLPTQEVKEVVERVKSGELPPSQAKREVDETKRSRGTKVSRSRKEIVDALTELEEYDLAFDLVNWILGGSTYKSLEELIKVYNKQVHEDEAVAEAARR